MIIDGKQIAQTIRGELREQIAALRAEGKRAPKLAVVLVGHNPASETYVTNKLIVFRSHCSSLGELAGECLRFIGARLATMVIEVGGVYFLYEIIHQDEIIAKLETQVLVVIGNYFISRFIVFRDRKK